MVTLLVSEPMEVAVVDALGREVARMDLLPNKPYGWDVSGLASGIYYALGCRREGTSQCKLIILDK